MNKFIDFLVKNKKTVCYIGIVAMIINGLFLSGFLSIIVSIISILAVIFGAKEAF